MSTSAMTTLYDPAFDAQRHYRSVLNCTARPGSIGLLEGAQLDPVAGLNQATVMIALTLFSGDISFYLRADAVDAINFLRRHTQAVEAGAAHADFLLLDSKEMRDAISALRAAKQGELAFPERGATVILAVNAISPAPLNECLRLTLSGPGIETESSVFVSGITQEFLEVLQSCNREFPTGIDVFLTCDSLSAGACVLALPRTTKVRWETVQVSKEGAAWDM
jgi:alpha-D-ribose 1-methylphosphonate 5-triphosphate synthase subunit PhnH